MNDYLVELYHWIQTQDSTFNQRYSYEDFENNMQGLEYADEMYQWIASKDDTFTEREPIGVWTEKIKKKKDFGTSREKVLGTDPTELPSDTSQSTTQTTDPTTITPNQYEQEYSNAGLGLPNYNTTSESWGGLKSLLSQSTSQERKQPDYEGWFKINTPTSETTEEIDTDESIEETYTINEKEVDEKEFDEYTSAYETLIKDENDPFGASMKAVNEDLMTHEEQFVVPLLNYHFNQYGFTFEEAGGMGDAMTVTAANGETANINLDLFGGDNFFRNAMAALDVGEWSSGGKKKQRGKLAQFLIDNKAESRRLKLAKEGYSKLERKIVDDKKIDATITLLNKDANYFNTDIENWLKLNAQISTLDAVYGNLTQEQINQPGTRALYNKYIERKKQVQAMQGELMVRDSNLKNRGAQIDRLMGEYNEMQAEQGELSGATQNAWWDGVARIGAGLMNVIIDSTVGAMEYGGTSQGNYKKMYMGVAEEMFNIPFPEPGQYDSWDEYLTNLSVEQRSDVDSKVRDILKKDVKYQKYTYDEKGRAVRKAAPLGTFYSKESLKKWEKLGGNMGLIDAQRLGAREVLGSSSTTKQYNDLTKEGFWGGAYLGLVESLPAMIGGNNPAGWAQRTASMYAQVSDHLNEEMQNNPEFDNISENEKQAIMIPIGAVVATLEAVGLRNVLSQKGVMQAVLLRSLGKFRNMRQVKGKTFTDVVRNEVDNMLGRGTLTIIGAGMAEFETGFAQEIADLGGKYVYNELIKEKDMFSLPETFEDAVIQTLRAGAQEMVGGWIMGVPGAMNNMAASKDFTRMDDGMFEVFENMANEDIKDGKSSKIYTLWLKDQVNQGNLTLDKAKEQESMFNEIKGVYAQIPADYNIKQKKEALGLLLSKQRLEQEIEGKDPSSVTRQMDQIKTISQELAALSYKAYQDNQKTTRGRVEDDEVSEEDAINELKEEGVENPTPEQIKNKQDAIYKRSTKKMDAQESTEDSGQVGEGVSQQEPTTESEKETEIEDRAKTEEEVDSQELSDFEAMVDPESESEQDIDSNPVKTKKVIDSENNEQNVEVNEVSDNLSFTSSPNNRIKGKQSIIQQAKLAAQAVAKLFPSLKVVIHRDQESYSKLDKKNDKGFYQALDNTIHINLSEATGRTVAHEIFHGVLINKLKFNPKVAQAVTKRMVQALVRSKSIPKEVRAELRKFIKNYDSEIQNEERLAEIFGMIADNYTQLDAPTKSKIRKWIEAIAEKLGIEIGQSSQDVVDLLNTLAGKIQTGETITEGDVAALDKVSKKPDTKGYISVRKQKSAQNLGGNYNMNFKGFMPANIYNIQNLKRAAAELGLTVHAAYIREGYRSGELVGHYFKRNGRFFNPFTTVRKQKSINEIGREATNIIDIVRLGQMSNIKDNTIIAYLKNKGYKMGEIKPLMKVKGFTLENMPQAFANITGGMMNGLKLFDKIVAYRNKLMENNLTSVGVKITKLIQAVDKLKVDLDQPAIFDNKTRVKNIKARIKKLQKEINTIQDKARKDGKKLYKYTDGEIDQMTVEFLESTPEYQNESFENGFSSQQAQMIAQMKNAFQGRVLMDVGGRIKRAKQILTQRVKGRKELDQIKKDLRNFIRQSLPNYVFTRPEVIKLIRSITDANLENIENKKAEVIDFVNKKTNVALTQKIEKILNGKYEDVQAGRPKGYKVDNETRLRIEGIKKMINEINLNNTTEVNDKVQEILDTIAELEAKTDLTPKDRSDIADMNIVIDFLNAQLSFDEETSKTETLQDVLNNLESLIEIGKTELQRALFDKHLQLVAEFEALYYDITGLRIKTYIENPEFNDLLPESNKNRRLIKNPEVNDLLRDERLITEQRKNKIKNRAVKAVANLLTGTRNFIFRNSDLSTWMGIIGKMPGEILGNETQKITSVKVNEGTREYKARKMATTIAINTKLEEVYGKNWQKKAQDDSSLAPTGIFLNTGVEIPDMSQNQMAYLVAQYKDPANENSFKKKYGVDYKRIMAEMEAKLNKEVKELSRWQVEEFFPSLYEGYNQAYKKIYRTSMPWNQYYAGRIYREGRNEETDIMQLMATGKDAFSNFAAPASTKVRINNNNPIANMDQMATLVSYVNDMNYFVSMGEVINDMSKLFKNNDIRNQIVFNFGKTPYDSIIDMITKLGNRGVSNDKSMAWVNQITTSFVIGKLAINPTIFIKQLTSAPAYATFIGFRNWTKLATMSIGNYTSLWKEISQNSIYIQDRYGESILRTLESYSPSAVQSVVPSHVAGRYIDIMMYLVKQGDKGAIIVGGVPNYVFYKNKFKQDNPQATEQEAIDHAVRLFERDTKMTQQSSDLQDRDEFQTGAWYARGLNMFQTSIKQYFRQELMAAINIYRKSMSGSKEGKGTYWENTKRLMIYHSLLPIAFQYVAAGAPGVLAPWDDEDDLDLMRAGILGNLNAMFILGEIVTYFGDNWTGKPWTGQSSGGIPILEATAKFFQELQRADRYNVEPFDKNGKPRKPEAITKSKNARQELYLKAISDLANSFGIPTRQIIRLIDNSDKILSGEVSPEEFILYALQFSEYVVQSKAEREAKNKKEKKKAKMTVEEMRRYDPEAYYRYKMQQDAMKNSPQYLERQRLKALEKQRRQEYLNRLYK